MTAGFAVAGAVAVVAAVCLALLLRSLGSARSRERRTLHRLATTEDLARRREAEAVTATGERDALRSRLAEVGAAEAAADEARRARREAEDRLRLVTSQVEALTLDAERAEAENLARSRAAEDRAAGAEQVSANLRRLVAALWDLADLQQEWVRRTEAELSTASSTGGPTFGLGGALALEVVRTREESGTPGHLTVDLDDDPDPAEGILLLQALQVLLAAVARRCDGYHLDVRRQGPDIVAVLSCDGFDGGAPVVEDVRSLADVLTAAGAVADVADAGDALEARLRIPVLRGE